jgi:two-component system, NarL family, response regulator LiaR
MTIPGQPRTTTGDEGVRLGSVKGWKMEDIRIIVVDDHAVVREGTIRLLEQDPRLRVVAETDSGVEAIRLVREHQPDVLLLDLALPDLSGIEVARRVAVDAPATGIAILSAYDDENYVLAALEAGVSAYLLKTVPASDVIKAIHAVADGQVILHPSIASNLRQSIRHREAGAVGPDLTEREHEVLRLAACGLHNKEIAQQLFISIRTVEGHLSHILAKIGVASRTEAVVYGLAHGWFAADGLAANPCKDNGEHRDGP